MEQKENCIMRQQILDRVSSVTPLDTAAMEQAHSRQQQLTKPAGSLGRLEDIAIQMAGITRQPLPKVKQKTVVIMADVVVWPIQEREPHPAPVRPPKAQNYCP